jgi:hypothetical protein
MDANNQPAANAAPGNAHGQAGRAQQAVYDTSHGGHYGTLPVACLSPFFLIALHALPRRTPSPRRPVSADLQPV